MMNDLFCKVFGRALLSTRPGTGLRGISFHLHNTAKGNVKTRRTTLCPKTPTVRYNKSRRERYNKGF